MHLVFSLHSLYLVPSALSPAWTAPGLFCPQPPEWAIENTWHHNALWLKTSSGFFHNWNKMQNPPSALEALLDPLPKPHQISELISLFPSLG